MQLYDEITQHYPPCLHVSPYQRQGAEAAPKVNDGPTGLDGRIGLGSPRWSAP